jgi:peroxiredoxin
MDAGKRAVAFNFRNANWNKIYATENATKFCSVFFTSNGGIHLANLLDLPTNLPVPENDGKTDHLVGMKLADIELTSTQGKRVNIGQINGKLVIFCYPRTGKPGVALPEGWDKIPGARGCTPQSCSFRDRYNELKQLGAELFGLSTQSTEYQQEMAERLHLPFEVLSDDEFKFSKAMKLPLFEVERMQLIKRITMIAIDGVIVTVHYPVFPSDGDAVWVVDWLHNN